MLLLASKHQAGVHLYTDHGLVGQIHTTRTTQFYIWSSSFGSLNQTLGLESNHSDMALRKAVSVSKYLPDL